MNIKYTGNKILELFSQYAVNRNNYIEKLIRKYMPDVEEKQILILEFGAGRGEFIDRFTDKVIYTTIAVENESAYRQILSAKHNVYDTIEDAPSKIDFIFLIDVLEHLEDDQEHLRAFYNKLKPGGRLFIYVPARMELYSNFDSSIGHIRRYNRKELISKTREAGFTVLDCRYHEFLGYFAALVNNKLLNQSEPSVRAIKLYDSFLVPLTNWIEKFIYPPIGKSIYLCAVKTGE